MRVCLGGTFDPFHAGHRSLLETAMDGADELFVGVTDGQLAARPGREVASWPERAKRVEAFLRGAGYKGRLFVRPLTDAAGPAATGDYDRIVASYETRGGAERINRSRRAAGLSELDLVVVPPLLGSDLLPVSATRVHAGDVGEDGVRLTPVRVSVGSANPVKIAAVESEVARILGTPVAVQAYDVASGVPEQPREDQTLAGARGRAEAALEAWPDADYAVGVEAGLNQDTAGAAWYDAQACVVLDRSGHATDGWGPAFQYPDWVTRRALEGEMISDILGPVAGDPRIGGTTGAVGYLTDGLLERTELTRIAVLMAFVPRIRRSLYVQEPRARPAPGPAPVRGPSRQAD